LALITIKINLQAAMGVSDFESVKHYWIPPQDHPGFWIKGDRGALCMWKGIDDWWLL